MQALEMILMGLAAAALGQAAPATAVDPHAGHAGNAAAAHTIDPDIDAFVCNYFGLVEKGDPAAILAEIDTDFVIKWPVGAPITDREQLRQALTALQARVRQQVRWKTLETRVHGDWAWARVEETAVHEPRAGGPKRTLEGSHLMILRRVDGRWLLHRDYGALNAMPAAGAAPTS